MNRPALLKQTLTRLFESTVGIDVEAVVVIDDNVESVDVCDALIAEGKNIVYSYSKERRGAIYCWNYGLKMARADCFFHMGDDLDFTDGWLGIALEAHRTKLGGYGLCGVNDSMHNGNTTVSTHMIFDRAFCKAVLGGVMANPLFIYYGVDVWLTEKARQAGKYYWCEESVVKHIHPANNGRPIDDTDRSHGDAAWNRDIPLMEQMRGAGLPVTWDAVI
jgi:glycosyltransferase involved in cell wall biosynthesis